MKEAGKLQLPALQASGSEQKPVDSALNWIEFGSQVTGDISVDLINQRITKLARRRKLGIEGFAKTQNH